MNITTRTFPHTMAEAFPHDRVSQGQCIYRYVPRSKAPRAGYVAALIIALGVLIWSWL